MVQGIGSQLNPIRTIDLVMARLDEESQKASRAEQQKNDDIYYEGPKAWKYLVRHWTTISTSLAVFIIILLFWALMYTLFPDSLPPDSVLVRMGFLFTGAQLCGYVMQSLNLPDMLGMIFWGVLYTNIGLGHFEGFGMLEATLREMALVNIMLLAGLGLDLDALRKLFGMVFRLTVVPTFAETAIIAVLARYVMDMPWLWGILLGLVVTAVSPNVVVTILLRLKEERLGLNKGIHTLIIAMTSCNDVISIFLFGVILGVIFTTGSLSEQLLQGPVGIGVGIVYGFLYGVLLWFMPSPEAKYANALRFTMMLLGGTFSVMASKFIGYPSAGALGCITIAFVAGIGWRKQQTASLPTTAAAAGMLDENASEATDGMLNNGMVPPDYMAAEAPPKVQPNDVEAKMNLLWLFLKPVSFALIGKEVDFAKLDGTIVAYGVLILVVGSVFRLVTAYLSAMGGDLTWKERAYVTISGFPKATVQAALGPIALDLARQQTDPAVLVLANNVLVVSVLAIILTAPLGAVLMIKLAPRWLQHGDDEAVTRRRAVETYIVPVGS